MATDLQQAMSKHEVGKLPDSELTPKQLKKRKDNARYRDSKRAKDKVKAARNEVPTEGISMAPAKRTRKRRKTAKKTTRRAKGNFIPLSAIPEDTPKRSNKKIRNPKQWNNPKHESMELKLLRAGLASLELLAEMMEKK